MTDTRHTPESDGPQLSDKDRELLERIRPESLRQPAGKSRNLFVRNILNVVFIIIAIAAMVGLMVDNGHPMTWYALGLFAVLVKMVEVVMRMPGLKR